MKNIQIIIRDGIVEAVLANGEVDANIEIIQADRDYEDYDQLDAYIEKSYADPQNHEVDFAIVHFDEN